MKCSINSKNNFLLNTYLNKNYDFYSTFPENKISMKNKIKNQNFEFVSVKGEVKNHSNIPFKTHQILLGSLLGDMHCNKEAVNAKIEETHSILQKDYLLWKYKNLNIFNNSIRERHYPKCISKGKVYTRKPQIRLWSRVSPKLNLYYHLFYPNGKKKIRREILDQINTLALAVWYCDDGSYDYYDKHIRIHTEGFSYKENLLLKEWLKNKWSIVSSFKKAHTGQIGLKLDVKNTDKFLRLIKNHLLEMPTSIRYKLGHLWEGNISILNKIRKKKILRMEKYESRPEIKKRKRQRDREYYHKNKEKMLNYTKEHHKSPKYKIYLREYIKRPEVKQRRKEYDKKYRKQSKYKKWVLEYQQEYRKRPEVKEKIKEYNRRAREKRKKGDGS